MELAVRTLFDSEAHGAVMKYPVRKALHFSAQIFHDLPPTSFTHLQSKHYIMQSTVPGFGKEIGYCFVYVKLFFLIYPELILPTGVLNNYCYLDFFIWRSKNGFRIFFFGVLFFPPGNQSSILIKSILNLVTFSLIIYAACLKWKALHLQVDLPFSRVPAKDSCF